MNNESISQKPAFVLVHGAWHSGKCWDGVVDALSARGYAAISLDLPGAGANAQSPKSFDTRPLDGGLFATEPSPNAGVSQAVRTAAVLDAVEQAGKLGNGKVILAGHSLGGITLSPVCEAAPEKITAVVYVAAFMLPPGLPAVAMIQSDIMADALVPGLFLADPEKVRALRLDPKSDDAAYVAQLRQAFYGDLSDAAFHHATEGLHCDEPVGVAARPCEITQARFGRIPRHYIRCLLDRAIPLAGQDHMIGAVDAAMGSKTHIETMATSHSPFYSQPDILAGLLGKIAAESG